MSNHSTHAARILLQTLAAAGVRHVVVSPGSRSAPLAHALGQAALPYADRDRNAPHVNVYVRIDERSAGFLAVGLARAGAAQGDPAPVAVVTTSGSAVGNLHPAVLEAHHAGLPLLLLTADRPHEMRGTGANQTTDQVGLFAGAVRLVLDMSAPVGGPREVDHFRRIGAEAVQVATGARSGDPGPVHINLAFSEPLAPDDEAWPVRPLPVRERGSRLRAPADEAAPAGGSGGIGPRPRGWNNQEPTVVVAGDGSGAVARTIAEAHGWPLLAEPSSGARGGPTAIPAYRLVLDTLGTQVRRVVVLGRPTLSRSVHDLIARRDVRSLVVAHPGSAQPDAGRGASHVLSEVQPWLLDTSDTGDPGWLELWQDAGRSGLAAVRAVLDDLPTGAGALAGPDVAVEIAGALAADDVLVVGPSNPIRDLDLVADWDAPPIVVANRGLSGIDGITSTAVGVALGLDQPVRAYLGDLTLLHDIGGLLVGPLERRPDLRLVVANDDGGSVFAGIEHGDAAHAAVFERVFGTPHRVNMAALCAGYGVGHIRVEDRATLREVLEGPVNGLSVVEVVVDRFGRRDLHTRLSAAVAAALAGSGEPRRVPEKTVALATKAGPGAAAP